MITTSHKSTDQLAAYGRLTAIHPDSSDLTGFAQIYQVSMATYIEPEIKAPDLKQHV
jgi:hypothetical protein